jgi:hypothetical protein
MTSKSEEMLDAFGRRMRYNTETYDLYKEVKVSVFIKLRRLQWAGHVIQMNDERIPKKALQQTI